MKNVNYKEVGGNKIRVKKAESKPDSFSSFLLSRYTKFLSMLDEF